MMKIQTVNQMNPTELSQKIIVLLVDDQEMIAEGIRRMLADEIDIEFHYCNDPTKAVNRAAEISATVVLQDLVMPDIDGMTLVRFYRANHLTKDIPIIVLSSKEEPKTKGEAFNHGANDYLVKLPDKIELIARIRSHSKHYIMKMERDAAFTALRKMQEQLEKSNEELQRLSAIDGLTGIANRRKFDETLLHEWRRSMRSQDEISIILIDIDYFKPFNDTYGHQSGDDCLKNVANALRKNISRESDMAARYGGEEFVVVLPSTNNVGAVVVAEKIRSSILALNIPHAASKVADCVTASLGVATLVPMDDNQQNTLIEKADKALYRAKDQGRNQVVNAEQSAGD